jgi:hypothetical protein
VESVGLLPVEAWREALKRARHRGELLGFDPETYPLHFGVLANHGIALEDAVAARYPQPGPLAFSELMRFFERTAGRYDVEVSEQSPPRRPSAPLPSPQPRA